MENLRTIMQIIKDGSGAYGYELTVALEDLIKQEYEETGRVVELNENKFYTTKEIINQFNGEASLYLYDMYVDYKTKFDSRIEVVLVETHNEIDKLDKHKDVLLNKLTFCLFKDSVDGGKDNFDVIKEIEDIDDRLIILNKIVNVVENDKDKIKSELLIKVTQIEKRIELNTKIDIESVCRYLRNNSCATKIIDVVFEKYKKCVEYLVEDEGFLSMGGSNWDGTYDKIEEIAYEYFTSGIRSNRLLLSKESKQSIEQGVLKFLELYSTEIEDSADWIDIIEKKIAEIESVNGDDEAILALKEKLEWYK